MPDDHPTLRDERAAFWALSDLVDDFLDEDSDMTSDDLAARRHELWKRYVRTGSGITDAHDQCATAPAGCQDGGGAEMISTERQRQIDQEGYTPTRDESLPDGELAEAALAYLAEAVGGIECGIAIYMGLHFWPWDQDAWKPSRDDPVRDLVKAGALIAAEIDRRRLLLAKQETKHVY